MNGRSTCERLLSAMARGVGDAIRGSAIRAALLLLLGWAALPAGAGGQLPGVLEAGPDPVPVLVVPGWGDQAADVDPMRDRLLEAGWPERRVRTLSFEDPFGSNAEHADEIATSIRVLTAMSGVDRVDVVAHSMGGLAVRHYLKRAAEVDGEVPVRRVVFLGTPHRGTVAAILAWGDGGREMVPGSEFLMRLNEGDPVPEGVRALSLRTPIDLRVIPASSALLRGERVENREVCCPTHTQLVDDEETFRAILRFLLPAAGSDRIGAGVDPPRPAWYPSAPRQEIVEDSAPIV